MDRAPARGSLSDPWDPSDPRDQCDPSDPRDSHAVYLCEYSRISL
jgi:hypothetical protein